MTRTLHLKIAARRLANAARTLLFVGILCPTLHAQDHPGADLDSAFTELIRGEWQKHPEMQVQDLYKFVHHSAMGPGHAVADTGGARSWMDREIASLDLDHETDEPVLVLLRPDSALVRVNLRPYLRSGGDPEALLQAFITTANSYRPAPEQLLKHWSVVMDLIRERELNLDADSATALFEEMRKAGFPAVHHSSGYEEKYRPAYRVVDPRFLTD